MNTLRTELQQYFDEAHPSSKIDAVYSIGGSVHIRLGLGEGHDNGTLARVEQATQRATTLFNEVFEDPSHEIWVLIYEYPEPEFIPRTRGYLEQQFPAGRFSHFYDEVEEINTPYTTEDEDGNTIQERTTVRIIIGRLPVGEIKHSKIWQGIANAEMGFNPSLNQRIAFFDPMTDRGFLMYDDRGCYIWSNTAEKIRAIYQKRKDWIPEYHRKEIASFFRKNKQ